MKRGEGRRAGMLGLFVPLGLAIGAGVLAVAHPSVLFAAITRIVVVGDVLVPADFAFVLNGRIATRVDGAARLYHEGVVPQIRLAHTREMARRPDRPLSELIAAEIVARDVPSTAVGIVPFPRGVVDTRDEARALRRYLEAHPAESVIIVTTDHHTGRARRTFRQELRGMDVRLQMAPAPDGRDIRPTNWWETAEGRRIYGEELLKQIGTIAQHLTGIR